MARESEDADEDLKDASGGDREDWFEERGCLESRYSASNCRRNGINPAIFAKGQHRIKTE